MGLKLGSKGVSSGRGSHEGGQSSFLWLEDEEGGLVAVHEDDDQIKIFCGVPRPDMWDMWHHVTSNQVHGSFGFAWR